MSRNIDPIVNTLKNELVSLENRQAEAMKQVETIRREVQRVRNALQALTGEMPAPSPRVGSAPVASSSSASGNGKSRAPRQREDTLSREEVHSLVLKTIEKQGPLTDKQIRTHLAEHAELMGKSRKGLHFAIAGALKNGPFRPVGDKWTLIGRDGGR